MNRFTSEEADNLYLCLSLRRNLIVTGDCHTDAAQAARKKMPFKELSSDQMKIVLQIDKLMEECMRCL